MRRLLTLFVAFTLLIPAVAVAETPTALKADDLVTRPFVEYPFAARRARLEGSGVFLLHVTPEGVVSRVDVQKSTGHTFLDATATTAFRTFRFRRGKNRVYISPMTFTLDRPGQRRR